MLLFIADYHSMNSVRDGAQRRAFTRSVALDYLACGLDPQRAMLFRQSDVPEVTELAWLLSTVTPMGLLERAVLVQGQGGAGPARRSRPVRLSRAPGRRHPDLPLRARAGRPGPEAAHRDGARHRAALQQRLRRRPARAARALHPRGGGGGAGHRRAQDEQVVRQHDRDVRGAGRDQEGGDGDRHRLDAGRGAEGPDARTCSSSGRCSRARTSARRCSRARARAGSATAR